MNSYSRMKNEEKNPPNNLGRLIVYLVLLIKLNIVPPLCLMHQLGSSFDV